MFTGCLGVLEGWSLEGDILSGSFWRLQSQSSVKIVRAGTLETRAAYVELRI